MGGPGATRLRQRGAALIDVVVGAAVALMILSLLVSALHAMTVAAASRHAAMLARTQSDQLFERMQAEAASAWSVFVPNAGVNGESNADGHEIDFAVQDATRHIFRFAYSFDARTQTVTRYAVAAGQPPQPGPAASPFTAFTARAFPATAIADATSPIYDPLFAATSVTPVAYALPDGSVAGNGFVQVTISGADTSRTELLATATAPTQFTVVVRYTPAPQ